jgi:hypothetical protein
MRDSSPLFSFLFFVFLSVAVTKNHSGFLTRITWFSDPTWVKVWILNFNQIIGLFWLIFFLKSKRCHFSKKNQRVATEFLTESLSQLGHTRFFLLLFFFQPSLVSVPSQLDPELPPDQVGFKTMPQRFKHMPLRSSENKRKKTIKVTGNVHTPSN